MSPLQVVFVLVAGSCIALGIAGVFFLVSIYWRSRQ